MLLLWNFLRKGFDSKPTWTGLIFWVLAQQPWFPDIQQTERLSECLTSKNKEASDKRQQRDVEGTAESHKRDDEGDDDDDEAYDHQSSDSLGPCWRENQEEDLQWYAAYSFHHSHTDVFQYSKEIKE